MRPSSGNEAVGVLCSIAMQVALNENCVTGRFHLAIMNRNRHANYLRFSLLVISPQVSMIDYQLPFGYYLSLFLLTSHYQPLSLLLINQYTVQTMLIFDQTPSLTTHPPLKCITRDPPQTPSHKLVPQLTISTLKLVASLVTANL